MQTGQQREGKPNVTFLKKLNDHLLENLSNRLLCLSFLAAPGLFFSLISQGRVEFRKETYACYGYVAMFLCMRLD